MTKTISLPARDTRGFEIPGKQLTYYVDGIPDELRGKNNFRYRGEFAEGEYGQIKLCIYNHKYTDNDFDIVAQLRGFFEGMGGKDKPLEQPSENQVRTAMIWSCEDYKIKSGGGSASDHCYSSSLTICIADPKTWEDKDVVLIKKYSTEFADVLITMHEVEQLFEACVNEAGRSAHAEDIAIMLLREIKRNEFIKLKHKDGIKACAVPYTKQTIINCIKHELSKNKATLPLYEDVYKSFVKYYEDDMNEKYVNGDGEDVSEKHKADSKRWLQACHNSIELVREVLTV